MGNPKMNSHLRKIALNVIIAILVIILGELGRLIPIPAFFHINPFWIPSGFALAVCLLFGWDTIWGILIGSLFIYLTNSTGTANLSLSLFSAITLPFQIWLSTWTIKKITRAIPPETISDTIWSILSLIGYSFLLTNLRITALCYISPEYWSDYFAIVGFNWLIDCVGLLTFAPILIVIHINIRKSKTKEPYLWLITSLIIGITFFSFLVIKSSEKQQLETSIANDLNIVSNSLDNTIDHNIQSLRAVQGLAEASPSIDRLSFEAFTAPLLSNSSAMNGISWVPRVKLSERTAYEKKFQDEGFQNFTIYQKDENGNNLPASKRDEYYSVTFIEPIAANRTALGYDIGSNPDRLGTIIKAIDSGEIATTPPIRLVQADNEIGILVMMPVYRNNAPIVTTEQRRNNFLGLANGVYLLNNLLISSIQDIERPDVDVFLYDIENSEEPTFLAFFPASNGPETLPESEIPSIQMVQGDGYYSTTLDTTNRKWLLAIKPTHEYIAEFNSWTGWFTLLIGSLFSVAFLVFYRSRQNNESRLRRSEAEFRALSENALTGVGQFNLNGIFTYSNEAMAKIFGYDASVDLLGTNLQTYFTETGLFDEMISTFQAEGTIRNQEAEIRTARGTLRKILFAASFHETLVSMTMVDMTDRIRLGNEFKQLSRVVSQMADIVIITNLNGIVEYVNPSFERVTGYNREEVIGQNMRILKSGFHNDDFYKILWDTILSGKVFQDDMVNRKKNGELYHQTQTITPIRGEGNKITHFVLTGKDITDSSKANELLMKSKSNDEIKHSTSRLGNWEMNIESGESYWSKEMFEMFDLSPTKGTPDFINLLKLLHPEDRSAMVEARNRYLESRQVVILDVRMKPEGKQQKYLQVTIHGIKDSQGNLSRIAGTFLDITEIKTAQIALEELNRDLEKRVEERTEEVRKREATYRALFDNSNDGIFLMSPTGDDIDANEQALAMIGYSLEEFLKLSQVEPNFISAPQQKEPSNNRFKSVIRGEKIPLYETTFIRKDKSKLDVEINLSAIRNEHGEVILVQSVVRNITERKRAAEELRESRDKLSAANAALEKASKMKDEFLASMSHELRTPLTSILGLSEALQMFTFGDLNEKQLKFLKEIENSGRHLLELINDILDLSKIEAGKLDILLEPFSVYDLCQSSMQLIKGMAHQKKQKVSFTCDPATFNMVADSRRLKQMLVNLLSNAIKFTPAEGLLGLVVCADGKKQIVTFTVWDKGIGIKQEDLSRLFTPFMQIDSRLSRQYSGTGLGLSLVLRMAELQGGSVSVESTFGEGSQFTITLPWNQPEIPAKPTSEQALTKNISKVLVIDADIQVTDPISDHLKSLDIHCIIHPTMRSGFEKAGANRPDVILLEQNLPDGSGQILLKKLMGDKLTNDIPVIFTATTDIRNEVVELGATGFLQKPFEMSDLDIEFSKIGSLQKTKRSVEHHPAAENAPLVLLADDNEKTIEMLSAFMDANNLRVVAVRNGLELLQVGPEILPNILLVDIQMPGIDGFETIKRIRSHPNTIFAATPIVAITALAMNGDRERCIEAGANEYMSKPIKMKMLLDLIMEIKR